EIGASASTWRHRVAVLLRAAGEYPDSNNQSDGKQRKVTAGLLQSLHDCLHRPKAPGKVRPLTRTKSGHSDELTTAVGPNHLTRPLPRTAPPFIAPRACRGTC